MTLCLKLYGRRGGPLWKMKPLSSRVFLSIINTLIIKGASDNKVEILALAVMQVDILVEFVFCF